MTAMSLPLRLLPLLLAVLLWMPLACAHPAASGSAPNQASRQPASTRRKLTAVHAKIVLLATRQKQTIARRHALDARIATQSVRLSTAATALHKINKILRIQRRQLVRLEARRKHEQQRLAGQRLALANLLRAVYTMGRHNKLRVLLSGSSEVRIQRALGYSRILQQAQLQRIQTLLDDLTQLHNLGIEITRRTQTLSATRTQQTLRISERQQQRARLMTLRQQAERRYRSQSVRLTLLRNDERNLRTLIGHLQGLFGDIPPNAPGNRPFTSRRGQLPWPVSGKTRNWRDGLQIFAVGGAMVHAVASGRVVYASWLRGFGMLVIIDQGQGWMSLYGNNESLEVSVGDWVQPGQVLATAGTATAGFKGVYFGIRHNSKPVNPRRWLQ